MAGIYCLLFFFNPGLESMIVYGVMTAIIMFASYFNLKHFIFPDVEFGIIRSIRGYNLIALLLGVLSVGEISLLLWNKTVPLLILYIAICVVSIAVVPVLEKGVKKWTI
jgi:cell division protein FtsW (lipid II flippase)